MKKLVFKLILLAFFSISGVTDAHFSFIYPTTKENPAIDNLISQAEKLSELEKYNEALALYERAIQQSSRENYSKGLTKGYIGAAQVLFVQKKLDKSTEYLVKAKSEDYAKDSPEELANIYFREALNLHELGLYEQAIRRYKASISEAEKIKDKDAKINQISKTYVNIGDVYQLRNWTDSAMYFYKAAYHSPSKNFNSKFYSSVSLTDMYLEKGKLDSAQYFLSKAFDYSHKVGTKYSEAVYAEYVGKVFEKSGNLDSAATYFLKSYALKKSLKQYDPRLLKRLSQVYAQMGKETESNRFLARYVALSDSLEAANRNNVQVPVIIAKDIAKTKLKSAESKTMTLLIVLGITATALAVLVYLYIKKQRKRIYIRKAENTQLKKKLNSAFEEVAELAQINSPNFLSRFIEVYPEFYNYLISTYPDLTNADLKLCALMKLDYSTKEIAEITYSSIRTIQNRKYKLRKKFNLTPEENLNLWIQNLHIQSLHLN